MKVNQSSKSVSPCSKRHRPKTFPRQWLDLQGGSNANVFQPYHSINTMLIRRLITIPCKQSKDDLFYHETPTRMLISDQFNERVVKTTLEASANNSVIWDEYFCPFALVSNTASRTPAR